ncbi:MAG: aminotransferase class I/II-fold pyridoxal phosphate-dependent enzyme, partial [Tenericutes bacterium]|nr:aminotransferase class I/II-fold pyridoxal phosphate-dependent enzyme [Mycoplasmatota bacterium]
RIVGKHAQHKKLESNILQISQEAKAMKKKYKDVIDATVGMLHHENGKVFSYQVVNDLLHHLSDPETYHYAPVRGTEKFREGVFNWVFGKYADTLKEHFKCSIIPTTGGSAAISNTFYNFNDFGQKILIPNHYWSPYKNFAMEANVDLETFLMYDENFNFNIKDFKEKAAKLAKEQGRLCLLLNDPCNNPTGLSMTIDDWKQIIQTLNTIKKTGVPVILIHDIAYIDYQTEVTELSRDVFSTFTELDSEILVVVIFSGSKTFSLYGFRVGAQIGLSKSQEVLDHFTRVGDYSVRGRFSSVSQPGMSIIEKIFTDKEYKQRFESELVIGRKLLQDRAKLFIQAAEENNLQTLPYFGGFFVSILTKNKNIFRDLVNDRVFLIPMQGLIRVALSSLNVDDISELVRKIKKYI